MSDRLNFHRYVLIVAAERDASADEVQPTISRSVAQEVLEAPFGGADDLVLYSDPLRDAGICCFEHIRRRPLRCDNKRVAYKCMQEMLARYPWAQFNADPEKIKEMLDGVGDGLKDEVELIEWLR